MGLHIYHRYLQLRAAFRFLSLTLTHPCHLVFHSLFCRARMPMVIPRLDDSRASPLLRKLSNSTIPLWIEHVHGAGIGWQIVFPLRPAAPPPDDKPTSLTLSIPFILSHSRWRSHPAGPTALHEILDEPVRPSSSSSYLFLDPRPIQVLRARLRFDAARLNFSLHKRRQVPSPRCAHCSSIRPYAVFVDESVHHVLLDCPRYEEARTRLFHDALNLLSPAVEVTLSLSFVLHPLSVPDLNKYQRSRLLYLTGLFISRVHELRDF